MVFQLVYASTAVRPFGATALTDLVTRARASNAEHRITGMLLHREHRFLQLLEGREDDVLRLYASIAADDRHRDVGTLSRRRRVLRQFATWSMAFRDLTAEPIREPGYTSLFEDTVERIPGAVDHFVPRLRPSGPAGRPVIPLAADPLTPPDL